VKVVVQRVKYASVKVDDKVIGSIEQGFLVLLGARKRRRTGRFRISSKKSY